MIKNQQGFSFVECLGCICFGVLATAFLVFLLPPARFSAGSLWR